MPCSAPRRRSLLAGLFAVAATTGCATGGREPGRTGGGPEDGTRPSGALSPTTSGGAPDMPAGVLLDWLVTGGYASVHVRTLLHGDGTYTVTAKGAASRGGRLPAGEVSRIRALLAEARLGEGPRRSIDPRLRDGFHYRIAHGGHVVHRDDTTLGAPLRRVRDLLPAG